MVGAGETLSHGKAAPSQPGQNAKNIQIGGVVAAEQDGTSLERLLPRQLEDGAALVDAQRPRLDHRLAVQDVYFFRLEQFGMLLHRRGENRQGFRRQPVMQRQSAFLVLQQKAGNVIGKAGEYLPHQNRATARCARLRL